MGVKLLPLSFVTYSVFRSHAGTTCCGSPPTAKCSTTRAVEGSMTSTVSLIEFGTYTSGRSFLTTSDNAFGRSAA